jgi:hypothetical protein
VSGFLRFPDWPLRVKVAVLLGISSLLPLAAVTLIDIQQARQRLVTSAAALLSAKRSTR